jgi:hypothetical protein
VASDRPIRFTDVLLNYHGSDDCTDDFNRALAAHPEQTDPRHVGDSDFEGWYAGYTPNHHGPLKQIARDAYAAGLRDVPEQAEGAGAVVPSDSKVVDLRQPKPGSREAYEAAVVKAALDLCGHTLCHEFRLPVPHTEPQLFVALTEWNASAALRVEGLLAALQTARAGFVDMREAVERGMEGDAIAEAESSVRLLDAELSAGAGLLAPAAPHQPTDTQAAGRDAQDAARYRKWRDTYASVDNTDDDAWTPEAVDAEIDAAIAATKGEAS